MTYTADDFAKAEFARHPDGRLAHKAPDESWQTTRGGGLGLCTWWNADADMVLAGWVPVQESHPDDVDLPGEMRRIAEEHQLVVARAEKAEKERDDTAVLLEATEAALAGARGQKKRAERERDGIRKLHEGQIEIIAKLQREAEPPRPLTADDITDEMVKRAQDMVALRDTFISAATIRLALRHALADLPARPAWAGVLDVLDTEWPEGINGADNTHIARMLHQSGVRVQEPTR